MCRWVDVMRRHSHMCRWVDAMRRHSHVSMGRRHASAPKRRFLFYFYGSMESQRTYILRPGSLPELWAEPHRTASQLQAARIDFHCKELRYELATINLFLILKKKLKHLHKPWNLWFYLGYSIIIHKCYNIKQSPFTCNNNTAAPLQSIQSLPPPLSLYSLHTAALYSLL